jgi:hypothetical protein
MATKTKARKITEPTKSKYTVTLTLLGKKYTATGTSPRDALEKIDIKSARGRGIIAVSNGEVTKERILLPMQVTKLFSSHGLFKEIALKNTAILFDGM